TASKRHDVLIPVTCPIPIPPHPMTARVGCSLGGVTPPPPSTCRGTIENAPAATAAPRMNRRRLIDRLLIIYELLVSHAPRARHTLPYQIARPIVAARARFGNHARQRRGPYPR